MSNMSNSEFSAAEEEEHKRTEEKIKECEKLWKNLEAELVAIFHGLIKKGGQPFTDLLKVHLECSICKGLINSAVSRHECFHTFCQDCLTHWTLRTKECPICRNDINLHVKNPIIDKIVDLLVDLSFTEKDKKERSKEIQKLSADRTTLIFLDEIQDENLQVEAVYSEYTLETSLPGRMACAKTANSFFSVIMSEFKFDKFFTTSIPDFLLHLHVEMYNSDLDSLELVYSSIPESVLRDSMFN